MRFSDEEDEKESLKIEMMKSETFLLETEYVNMEENTEYVKIVTVNLV